MPHWLVYFIPLAYALALGELANWLDRPNRLRTAAIKERSP